MPSLGFNLQVLPSEGGSPSLALTVPSPSGSPDGSAVFRGCFRRPNNLSLALPVTAAMPNMSVDKCVDLCTEKVSPGSCSQNSREGWGGTAERMGCLSGEAIAGMREVITVICDVGEGCDRFPWIQGAGVTQGQLLSL